MAIADFYINNILGRFTDRQVLVDVRSPKEIYIGFKRHADIADSDAKFNIVRISEIDSMIKTESPSDDEFKLIWDDRLTYFEPLPVTLPLTLRSLFDGINDSINFSDVHNFSRAQAFSIGCFINPNNTVAQRAIFSKTTNDANVHGFALYHNNTGKLFLQMRAPGYLRQHTFSTTLASGVSQSVMLTYSGGSNINGAKTYINGIEDPSSPASGTIIADWLSGQDFITGGRGTSFNFSGYMHNFYIINKELSQLEITEWHNNNIPILASEHSASANFKSHYRLGDDDEFPNILDNIENSDGTVIGSTESEFFKAAT